MAGKLYRHLKKGVSADERVSSEDYDWYEPTSMADLSNDENKKIILMLTHMSPDVKTDYMKKRASIEEKNKIAKENALSQDDAVVIPLPAPLDPFFDIKPQYVALSWNNLLEIMRYLPPEHRIFSAYIFSERPTSLFMDIEFDHMDMLAMESEDALLPTKRLNGASCGRNVIWNEHARQLRKSTSPLAKIMLKWKSGDSDEAKQARTEVERYIAQILYRCLVRFLRSELYFGPGFMKEEELVTKTSSERLEEEKEDLLWNQIVEQQLGTQGGTEQEEEEKEKEKELQDDSQSQPRALSFISQVNEEEKKEQFPQISCQVAVLTSSRPTKLSLHMHLTAGFI